MDSKVNDDNYSTGTHLNIGDVTVREVKAMVLKELANYC
jgi:hypothetical protein